MQPPTEKRSSRNHEMDKEEEADLPSQGDRTPSVRRSGDIVPVPAASSSYDGLAVESEESSTVAVAIASTSGRVERWSIDSTISGNVEELQLQPVVNLTMVDEDIVFRSPRKIRRKKRPTISTGGSFGSPPDSDRAQSSLMEVADVDMESDSSLRRVSGGRHSAGVVSDSAVCGGDPRRRRRPPTTGEWVGITAALEKYNAARAVALEMDDIEFIVNPKTGPRQTARKVDLPTIEDLRRELMDYSHLAIKKKAGESFSFLEKLSNKSRNFSGRLVHDLRIANRKLEASVAELCDRISRQDNAITKVKRGNDYLVKDISRLKGELEIARVEITSLRASVSPSGRSPPHKKSRGSSAAHMRDTGTQMEADGLFSPGLMGTPLLALPSLRVETVDRACSPLWGPGDLVDSSVPATSGKLDANGQGISPSGSRDITALEQSLLDHIEALFAQRSSLQEDIGRIRRELDDPHRESILSDADGVPVKTAKRRKKKKSRGGRMGVSSPPLPSPQVSRRDHIPNSGVRQDSRSLVVDETPWSKVVGRRAKRASRKASALAAGELSPPSPSASGGGGMSPVSRPVGRVDSRGRNTGRPDSRAPTDDGVRRGASGPRPPTTAVVSITLRPDAQVGYREIMLEARAKIDLGALGIANSRIRPAINGGILIQIPGKDRVRKANDLARQMEVALKDREVIIGRPSKYAELRVRGIDVSVVPDDIVSEIARLGGCDKADIRIGPLRESPVGLSSVWVRCPALAAKRVFGAGSIRVGWGRASVELLRPRPLLCYRCLRRGHVRQKCTSDIDRSNRCYRCGIPGHRAGSCRSGPKCPLCADLGMPDDHVWGGGGCVSHGAPVSGGSNDRDRVREMRALPTRAKGVPPRVSGESDVSASGGPSCLLFWPQHRQDYQMTTNIMADDITDINLLQQRCLGASAAGVVGATVPGTPTSSSHEGLSEVCEAGTSAQLATAEVKASGLGRAVDPKNDADPRSLKGYRSIDDILRDIDAKYMEDPPPKEVVGTSFDVDKETFFDDSPPPVCLGVGTEKMEVVSEDVPNKKRKANSSPIINPSSEDDTVAPPRSLRRSSRRNKLVDSEESVSKVVDLTEDYETPVGSDYADQADLDSNEGSLRKGKGKMASSAVTLSKRKKKTLRKSSIDFKNEFNCITQEELSDMGPVGAGTLGLDFTDMINAIRVNSGSFHGYWNGQMKTKLDRLRDVIQVLIRKAQSSGDSIFLESRIRDLFAELSEAKTVMARKKEEFNELKKENERLRQDMAGMRRKLGKLGNVKNENEELWRELRSLRSDFDDLKRGKDVPDRRASPVERAKKEFGKVAEKSSAEASVGMDWDPLPQRTPKLAARPRVTANVQLVPPRDAGTSARKRRKSSTSSTMVGREGQKERDVTTSITATSNKQKKKSKGKGGDKALVSGKARKASESSHPRDQPKDKEAISKRKRVKPMKGPPKTVAVSITGRSENFSYRDALIKARNEISLKELDIESTRLRRAANGGYLIEIMDKEGSGKAKALQEKLRALFSEEQATVACPTTFGEMRLIGLDDTISTKEVVEFITKEGNCDKDDVKVGRIQPMRNGLNTIWARCPLAAATIIASRKKVRMGWTFAKIELLKTRPIQCFKCWGYGHVRYACKTDVDRSRSCFNCGEEGHSLRDCRLPPRCVVCEAEGKGYNHRMGSSLCDANRKKAGACGSNFTGMSDPVRRAGVSLDKR
ncbi:hypothetical protein RF55_9831 [Lasius niger]|uniref:CCHC-type domain-containing protein n=1 Tax=Lasius niger TaxID=67767 RepID=A0A0J7KJ11_LASNI|nr:hypothetical protein RF55_9831 [Lasius niger]